MIGNVEDGARLIANLLAGRFGYDGDRLTYDDPRNADLIQVIDAPPRPAGGARHPLHACGARGGTWRLRASTRRRISW